MAPSKKKREEAGNDKIRGVERIPKAPGKKWKRLGRALACLRELLAVAYGLKTTFQGAAAAAAAISTMGMRKREKNINERKACNVYV